MNYARRVFTIAGIYGLIVLFPQYFLMEQNGRDFPPPINHPEFYYGFVGVALAWQVGFLIMGRDPVRYRPMMIPAILEKLSYGLAVLTLYSQGRVAQALVIFGVADLALAALFLLSYAKTGGEENPS